MRAPFGRGAHGLTLSLESDMRWYETVDTTMVVEPVVTATSSGTI